MAKGSSFDAGGAIGIVLGVVLIGGLAATPFYLSHLRSPKAALDLAVEDDLEAVRRFVLHIDQDTAALSNLRALIGKDGVVDADLAEELHKAHPDLFKDAVAETDLVLSLLRRADRADQDRGTANDKIRARLASGRMDARKVVTDIKATHGRRDRIQSLLRRIPLPRLHEGRRHPRP